MKQRITVKQWNEMPFEDQLEIIKWCKKKSYFTIRGGFFGISHPLLSIGQMIEFLGVDQMVTKLFISGESERGAWIEADYQEVELCDALWEAVKEIPNER